MNNQIPKNWQETKLGEIIKITRGASPRPIQNFLASDGMPWVKIADATASDSRFIDRTKECIRLEGVKNSVIVEPGELIVSNSATPGIPKFMRIKACVHDGWLIFRNFKGALPEFIFYYMIWARKKLVNTTTGSVFNNLKTDIVKQFKIDLPPIESQKKVVSILSAFDDKIEINNKIAKTLEEMAQALFKEWFVHFRFPGHEKTEFVDSELGKIPKGWRVGLVKDLGKVVTGKTPSTEVKENFGSEFPFITIPDMSSVFVINTGRYLSEKGSEKMQSMLLPTGSICVSCIATVGLVGITIQQSLTNQQINSIIPSKEDLTYFLYIYFKNKKKELELFGSGGTATLIVNKTKFENLDLVIPDRKILKDFHAIVKPMYEKILNITKENQKLAALRDLLLPKLMRGEIRV